MGWLDKLRGTNRAPGPLPYLPPPPGGGQATPPPAKASRARPGSHGLDLAFAVVDVETSGLDPKVDRVVEIAVVGVSSESRTLFEWSTLVNPGDGRAGRTDIHGIYPAWLAAAPTFAEIAGDLSAMLNHRVFTGHNVKFDAGFIDAEYRRAGAETGEYTSLDTMDLCHQLGLPGGLERACKQLDISYPAHSALNDARAAAALLCRFLGMIDPCTWEPLATELTQVPFPALAATGRSTDRVTAEQVSTAHDFLAVHAAALASGADEVTVDATQTYLASLRPAMDDGLVEPDEQARLVALAVELGMGVAAVRDAHGDYVMELIDDALADSKMSSAEKAHITRAAAWLGVDTSDWDVMVKAGRQRRKARIAQYKASMAGRTVAFTGRGVHPPNLREALAVKNDIVYRTTLNASCELLVVGSVTVDNAQVAKAHETGVPIIVEASFWQMLGEL
jgi:DNA polymerase III subunit epsilon